MIIETLLKIGAVVAALGGIGAFVWKIFKWVDNQHAQDDRINTLENKVDRLGINLENKITKEVSGMEKEFSGKLDKAVQNREKELSSVREEQTLTIKALLACLKGLQSQGCNGAVTDAIGEIEEHINNQAHNR